MDINFTRDDLIFIHAELVSAKAYMMYDLSSGKIPNVKHNITIYEKYEKIIDKLEEFIEEEQR